MRVLLIDDEEDLLDLVKMVLEDEGHQIDTVPVATREAVLAAAERLRPEVVLLDLVMPGASGDEVAGWLRSVPGLPPFSILVVSALSDAETRARHLGAKGFLAKPFTMEGLLEAVEKLDRTLPSGGPQPSRAIADNTRSVAHPPERRFMSGGRDSNPRPRAWEARALPTELPPRTTWDFMPRRTASSQGRRTLPKSDVRPSASRRARTPARRCA
jgi:DNA-binding response OmpR family regulator